MNKSSKKTWTKVMASVLSLRIAMRRLEVAVEKMVDAKEHAARQREALMLEDFLKSLQRR